VRFGVIFDGNEVLDAAGPSPCHPAAADSRGSEGPTQRDSPLYNALTGGWQGSTGAKIIRLPQAQSGKAPYR